MSTVIYDLFGQIFLLKLTSEKINK